MMNNKRPKHCCWNCTFAIFQKDAKGRRQAQYVGECIYAIPPLPTSLTRRALIKKMAITDRDGQECPVFAHA